MDPFSISTAVGSLLGLTGTLVLVLHDFVSNVHDAPHSAQEALFAVKEMGFVLSSAQSLLSDLVALRSTRKAMVELDHLVITITQSVITFKELESLICPEADARSSLITIRSRLKWAWKEEAVSRTVLRLQGHKSSLSLMLNILQCESDQEARIAQQSLHNMMEQLLLHDEDMRRRLSRIENYQFLRRSSANSAAAADDDDRSTIKASSIKAPTVRGSSSTRASTISNRLNTVSEESANFAFTDENFAVQQFLPNEREFEEVLGASRVYRRARSNDCDNSFTSSVPFSHAWSALSGFSLADISVISVIALPLDPKMVEAIACPSAPVLNVENTIVRDQLQRAQKRCTELETEAHKLQILADTSTDIFQANSELKAKRLTVVRLDAQREICVRELEVMVKHIVRAKAPSANPPFEMDEMKSSMSYDFAASLQRLRDTLEQQNEELWQKRNELTREIDELIQWKDKGFQVYESLSRKNCQLMEHKHEVFSFLS